MGDIFFEADAHNPDHWRYWGRERFHAARAKVLERQDHGCVTVGDLHKAAIELLKKEQEPRP